MSGLKIAAFALIAAGVLGLMYGGFTYTKSTHEARVGPVQLSIQENETVNVPIWAGLGAVLIGGVLFFIANRKT